MNLLLAETETETEPVQPVTETVAEVSLDALLAEAFASETVFREVLIELWQRSLGIINLTKETIELESERILDLENTDYDKSDEAVRIAERTVERLTKAIYQLEFKVDKIDAINYANKWHERANEIADERDKLGNELRELYPEFVTKLANLFARIDENAAAISALHGQAPRGEPLRLFEDAELVARGLESYSAAQPRLRDNLKLPNWSQPFEIFYPIPAPLNSFAVVMLNHMPAVDAKYAFGADWAAAQKIKDEQTKAEFAKRAALEAEQAASSKREYERAVVEQDRKARLGIRSTV